MKHLVASVALIAIMSCLPAMADETGALKGTLVMADGSTPVAHQEVTVVDLRTGETLATTKTDAVGAFRVDGLKAGVCLVKIAGKARVVVEVPAGAQAKIEMVNKSDSKAQGVRRGGTNRRKLIVNLIGGFVAGVTVAIIIIMVA